MSVPSRSLSCNAVGVRDLGVNKLDEILQWRSEIASGKRQGPHIFTSGVILDGPKEDSTNRWTIRTETEAVHAVDSLARRRVDFIKTHNGLSRPAYFAILRAAKAHNLKVASHLPRGIPVQRISSILLLTGGWRCSRSRGK